MNIIVRHILALFCSAFLIVCGYFIWKNKVDHEKHDIYYNSEQVTDIGQCDKHKCTFAYETYSGTKVYAESEDPVAVGQIVYQMCWKEKARGNMCYTRYETSKQ